MTRCWEANGKASEVSLDGDDMGCDLMDHDADDRGAIWWGAIWWTTVMIRGDKLMEAIAQGNLEATMMVDQMSLDEGAAMAMARERKWVLMMVGSAVEAQWKWVLMMMGRVQWRPIQWIGSGCGPLWR